MAYADDFATFVNAIRLIYNTLKGSTQTTDANIVTAGGDVDTLSPTELNLLNAGMNSLFSDHTQLAIRARSILDPIFSRIGRTIGSSAVASGRVVDYLQFFRDWRDYQFTQVDPTGGGEYVTGKGITVDTDPADSIIGTFRRLTVDWNAKDIEAGLHNQTITVEVVRKPSPSRIAGTISGGAGKLNPLDYLGGSNARPVPMEWLSDAAPGALTINPTWRTNQDTTDDEPVTVINNWVITPDSFSEIFIDRVNVWRNLVHCYSFSGMGGTSTISQDMPSGVLFDAYRPKAWFLPVYHITGWTGTISVTWGAITQIFTEADLTTSAWVNLAPNFDELLYPINFDAASPQWQISVETTSASGEVVIAGLFAMNMIEYEQWWYSAIVDSTDPNIGDEITYEDSIIEDGIFNTVLGFIWDTDDSVQAYLNTAGATLIPEPSGIIVDYP